MKQAVKFIVFLTVLSMLIASCSPAATPTVEPQVTVVKETQIVEGTPQIIEKIVTPTTAPVNKKGGVFTWGVPSEPPGFNPILNDNQTDLYTFALDAEPLTWGGENYPSTLEPVLAESWETSADGLVWTLHLRQGVKWHDGKDFTADDVLYWAKAIQDPATTGAEWLHPRFFTGEDPYVFEKVDDYTVKITTKEPVPNLLNLICAPLIPAHYFVDNSVSDAAMVNDKFNTDGNIGTGPFKFGEYKRGEAVILDANPDYWRGAPQLDQIVLKVIPDPQAMVTALQTGEVDFAQVNPEFVPQLVSNPKLTVNVYTLDSTRNVMINVQKPMLKDKRTRQAIMYALNRQAMIKTQDLGYGVPMDDVYSPTVSAYEPQTQYPYDVEKAKALLAEVGWVPGPDGILVADKVDGVPKGTRFSIKYNYTSVSDQFPTLVQSYLKAVGIEVTQFFQDYATFNGENRGKENKPYDLSTQSFGWLGADASAYNWLFAAGNAANAQTSYFNPDVQALFDKAKVTKDPTERDSYYKQAAKILWEDLPILPISLREWIFVSNKRAHIEDAGVNTSMFALFTLPEKIWVEK